jgi:hypothetical protein
VSVETAQGAGQVAVPGSGKPLVKPEHGEEQHADAWNNKEQQVRE